jgi:molybdenum cofactor cytidylyltransferase
MGLFVIVLAAGASTRFGSSKQMALIDGVPMLEHVARRVLTVSRPESVIVVLRQRCTELQAMVAPLGVRTIFNPVASGGIGTSIRAGVRSLPPHASATMIVLADQVRVTSADYFALIDCWQRHPGCRVAAAYAGSCGAPAIFPRADFETLATLHGDNGARRILLSDPQTLRLVPMPNAADDVDQPEDIKSFPADRTV